MRDANVSMVPEVEPEDPLVAIFSSSNFDAEMEAMNILGVLQSNGIPAIFTGPHVLPSLEFQVLVPEHSRAEAERILAQAEASGSEAADEAEAAGERGK